MIELAPPGQAVVVAAPGLVLREWHADDVATMVDLFDTAEMDRRTPLAAPFDLAAATCYVAAAHRARARAGSLQLVITEDGAEPLGEVLVFPTEESDAVELGYAVGAAHQGRGLARRAVLAVLPLAAHAGVSRAQLQISTDNAKSEAVALATGFGRTDRAPVERRRKGSVVVLMTWERLL